MPFIKRLSPQDAHDKVQDGKALLICAYDSDEKFSQMALDGAISFDEYRSMQPTLPRNKELIFYCACPKEASAVEQAAHAKRSGFQDVEVVAGGVEAWEDAGLPSVTIAAFI